MARPKKSRESRKTRLIVFRITEIEFKRLVSKAEIAGLRVNEIARLAALANSEHIIIKAHKACDPAILKRLDRIGSNLNQLVKNAHIYKHVPPQVEELCYHIDRIIQYAIEDEDES